MKHSTIRAAILFFFALAAALPSISPSQAAPDAPSFMNITRENIATLVTKNQIVRADVAAGKLAATWKSDKENSLTSYRERAETGTAWSPEARLGAASNGSYHTSAVAIHPATGLSHLVWADGREDVNGQLYYSRQLANGSFSPSVRLSTAGTLVVYPQIAIDSRGWIWAVWNVKINAEYNLRYRVSTDGGVTWGGEGEITNQSAGRMWVATDQKGGVHVAWWNGAIGYGYSTGGAFAVEYLPNPAGTFNAEPGVTVDKFGTVYVSYYRIVEEDNQTHKEIFLGTKQIGGTSWVITRMYSGGNIQYSIPIFADADGVVHLAWFDTSTTSDIMYTYKRPGEPWLSPAVNLTNDETLQFHVDVVGVNDASSVRAHVFFDDWETGNENATHIDHITVATDPLPRPVSAQPVLEGGKAFTKKTANLSVSFNAVEGSPNQVRYRWDAAPTNANAWVTYANPITVPGPGGLNATACVARSLFTQVRDSTTGEVQTPAKSDAITFDIGMQGNASIRSMTSPGAPQATQKMLAESYPIAGASDWIRSPTYVYQVQNEPQGCAGVFRYVALNTDDSFHQDSGGTARWVTIDPVLLSPEGSGWSEQSIVATVRITDNLFTGGTITRTLYLDDDPPSVTTALTDGLLTASNDGGTQALATLVFSDVQVTDDSYGAHIAQPDLAYWGVWVLVSNQNLGSAPEPSVFAQKGGAVMYVAPGVTETTISLISNDDDPGLAAGTRYIYLRFLDGAGNFSSEVLSTTVELQSGYSVPLLHVPMVRR